MKLRMSLTSPYVRKVRIFILEAGLDGIIEDVLTAPWSPETDLPKDNPLGKVPVLITDQGQALFDSPLICEYLDTKHGGPPLVPAPGPDRWRQLRIEATADGILDAAVAVRIETSMRPKELRWGDWVERQMRAVERGLDFLEVEAPGWGAEFLIGQVTAAATLGYLDFRKTCDWRHGRPNLQRWWEGVSARPSVVATEPKE